jgi:N-acetylneuraminic acid mutarotase
MTQLVPPSILLAIALTLTACAPGGDDSPPIENVGNVNAGWVTIDQPTSASTAATDSSSILMSGEAFISPNRFKCCTGSAEDDTRVTVTWTNATNGQRGSTNQRIFGGCGIGFPFGLICQHLWDAWVPLAIGVNNITITASDQDGNVGRKSLTVTRLPDVTSPAVNSTTPSASAVGTSLDEVISVTFSEPMDPATLHGGTFFVRDATNNLVAGSVTYLNGTATFTPVTPLARSTTYTAAITAGARDTSGNALTREHVWSFTTETDEWQPTSTLFAPFQRSGHTALWTGQEMMVWGGQEFAQGLLGGGGRYDPDTDSWQGVNTMNGPGPRNRHTAVWTGTEVIVWGGWNGSTYVNSGGRYNPTTNTWQQVSTAGAPSPRGQHTAVWTGSEMLIWGGWDGSTRFRTGGRYDPVTNSWRPLSELRAPSARNEHVAVWTGTLMLIWGGSDGTGNSSGSRYDPATDSWQTISSSGAPVARVTGETAVWTGTEMIVWGGFDQSVHYNSGGCYNPTTNLWQSTSLTEAPSPRTGHTAIWTGTEMIVWGGRDFALNFPASGGRYTPSHDRWRPMSTSSALSGRTGHTSVWTGKEMVVWGGNFTNTGGRYTP